MKDVLNGVFRALNSLLGLAMIVFGCMWILQGFDLAFKFGPMVGDKQWVLWGALLALVGIGQIWWSNTRASYYRGR